MSKVDSTLSLDAEESAEVLDMLDAITSNPHSSSPKVANSLFGVARQRSITRLKEPSRRDSPTLPWRSNSQRSTRNVSAPDANNQPAVPPPRPESPDIDTILANTPRPRRVSSSFFSTPSRAQSTLSVRKIPKFEEHADIVDDRSFASDFGSLLEDESGPEDGDGSETDSSIDIHTPLPHLMFRDGLLSPRSKLLPQTLPGSMYAEAFDENVPRAGSVLSLASTAGSVTTKSGLQKDPRDTVRRRVRHRDSTLLRAGMGLTTGLGWSDSEDEDAPSTLTRRLITTTIERKRSGSVTSPSRRDSQLGALSSRFGSPTSSAKSPIPRRATSISNMRSASVSFPTKGPTSPASGPGAGLRIPRGRAASTANVSSLVSSHIKASLSLSTSTSSLRSQPIPELAGSPTESTSTKAETSSVISSQPSRTRTDSAASTATSRSISSVSKPLAPFPKYKASTDSLNQGVQVSRSRTSSNVSASASTTSLSSTYSQHSTSTASSGSVVPRPLRLPQKGAFKVPSRSFSQDASLFSSAVSPARENDVVAKYQRARTLSDPPSEMRPSVASVQRSLTTSSSLKSSVAPPSASPTQRQRLVPSGARPRPRTGTGMVYRTSSYRTSSYAYASFHESATKLGGISPASPEGTIQAL